MGPTLQVSLDDFALEEVAKIIKHLRSKKAAGPDRIPAELWKFVANDEDALRWITHFVNLCWHHKEVPNDWHLAQVSAIFKKGRSDLCENYRPISLLSLGYKVFAGLVHTRLVEGRRGETLKLAVRISGRLRH